MASTTSVGFGGVLVRNMVEETTRDGSNEVAHAAAPDDVEMEAPSAKTPMRQDKKADSESGPETVEKDAPEAQAAMETAVASGDQAQPSVDEAVETTASSNLRDQEVAIQGEAQDDPMDGGAAAAKKSETDAADGLLNQSNGDAQAATTGNGVNDNGHKESEALSPSKRKECEPSNTKNGNAVALEKKTSVPVAMSNGDASPPPKKVKLSQPAESTVATNEPPSDAAAQTNGAPVVAVASTVIASAPIMISRDDMAKMEEDDGVVKFDVITNDGTPEHMVQLTTLKNIFARQLPKMPREYIVRLVFDRNHRSMLILKNGKHVIGGICYRPFEPNCFAEIAFCAINAADQVKGYGTRLMNHLKEYVKKSGITHFLTYADNYAIGYFKKQGFAKVVSMPRSNWFGYIKDYDGGTLMECVIHHQINYLRITSMVHQQRKKIQDKIKQRSHTDIVYPGLTQFAEGRTMDIYMVPGVKEAGWSQAVIRNSRVGTRDPGSLRTQLHQLWKAVSNHRSAWPFHEPVDTNLVVDYLDHIKEPMDLSLIQKRIDSGHYISRAQFKEDLCRMCTNCTSYNTPDTNYFKAAVDLQEFIEQRVQVTK